MHDLSLNDSLFRSFVCSLHGCRTQTPHVSSTVEAEVAPLHAQGKEIFVENLATFVAEGGVGGVTNVVDWERGY